MPTGTARQGQIQGQGERAKAIPTNGANVANVRRVQHAINQLVALLRRDERVQQAYHAWRETGAAANAEAAHQLIVDLGLGAYPWLSRLLVQDCAMQPRGLALVPDIPADWPAGKEKGGAPIVMRDIDYFYRAMVKRPPDSQRRIAREYLATLKAREMVAGDGRATVYAAIKKARGLLSAFNTSDNLPKK